MKFTVVLLVDVSEPENESYVIGEMTIAEAQEFIEFIKSYGTQDGYTYDDASYNYLDKTIEITVA